MISRLCGLIAGGVLIFTASLAPAGGPGLVTGGQGVFGGGVRFDEFSAASVYSDVHVRDQIYTMWGLYSEGYIPIPPYFALHPPVYYSAPIPRTYGYSPFAYPPEVMTPALHFGSVVEEPKPVINPYVEPSETPATETHTTAVTPLRIINPFVVDDGTRIAQQPADASP